MQSTNLLDRNKKEIFEGDLVTYKCGLDYKGILYEIKYLENAFIPVQVTGKRPGVELHKVDWKLIEVKGNIYEH
jgi:hypothetical protein